MPSAKTVRHAVVIGGGFIGLEMAENLVAQGIEVRLVERDEQFMPPIDKEMSLPIQWCLEKQKITVKPGKARVKTSVALTSFPIKRALR